MEFVELFIDSAILWIAAIFIGKQLFNNHASKNIATVTLIVIIFSSALAFLNMINFEFIKGILKILIVYTLQYLYFRLIFNESRAKTIIIALIYYICLCISEVIVAILISVLFIIINQQIAPLKNTIIINLLIALIEYIMVIKFKNKLRFSLTNTTINSKGIYLVYIILLITLALLVFKIPILKWEFNIEFVVTMLILFGFCIVAITLIKQRAQIQETTSKYQQLADYSDVTNELLENYRLVSHEHRNQLSIIRSLIDKNKKELINYVDGLVEKNENIKYPWIGQLNHLPISGLKGLINYKLMEMERKNLIVNIIVSTDLIKSKLNKLTMKEKDNLYSIMGVYLDNAIQAAEKSTKKEISLEIFKEDNDIVIILANSYSGTIDLEKIDEYGYTTKGKNHGVGLHIVKKIIEEENIFTQTRNVLDDYYIQKLRINLSNINLNKKSYK